MDRATWPQQKAGLHITPSLPHVPPLDRTGRRRVHLVIPVDVRRLAWPWRRDRTRNCAGCAAGVRVGTRCAAPHSCHSPDAGTVRASGTTSGRAEGGASVWQAPSSRSGSCCVLSSTPPACSKQDRKLNRCVQSSHPTAITCECTCTARSRPPACTPRSATLGLGGGCGGFSAASARRSSSSMRCTPLSIVSHVVSAASRCPALRRLSDSSCERTSAARQLFT